MERQMVEFILGVINRATVPADDATQQNLAAAKGWLRAIGTGQLLVAKKPEEVTT